MSGVDPELREVEKSLLSHSHEPERVAEILENRYSLTGAQKPYLVVAQSFAKQETQEEIAKRVSNRGIKKDDRPSRLAHARTGLSKFIKAAQTAQQKLEQRLRKDGGRNISLSAIITTKYLADHGIPAYEQYLPLNGLWNDYVTSLLFPHENSSAQSISLQHTVQIAGKLASADFHGAKLKVVSAKNPSMVGLQGIVLWEGRSNFVIVVKPNPESGISIREKIGGLRIVEKRGTLFQFTVKDANGASIDFDIVGSRFLYRTADRSGRKFKSKSVDDL